MKAGSHATRRGQLLRLALLLVSFAVVARWTFAEQAASLKIVADRAATFANKSNAHRTALSDLFRCKQEDLECRSRAVSHLSSADSKEGLSLVEQRPKQLQLSWPEFAASATRQTRLH